MIPPVFAIIGFKNSGKTTLVCRLIEYFTKIDIKVAVIKHAHHAFDIDQPGTDSFKHRQAGASQVVVTSDVRTAVIKEHHPDEQASIRQALSCVATDRVDLVLVEGFKQEAIKKLVLLRKNEEDYIKLKSLPNICAYAGDVRIHCDPLPFFHRDEIHKIADYMTKQLNLKVPE